jgi:carboxylesterase type B
MGAPRALRRRAQVNARTHSMKHVTCLLLVAIACVSHAYAQRVTRDIPYATAHERQVLDVYAPEGAKNLPVVFWIHGGGWQAGNKSMVGVKPKAFMEAGFVFVSINYRLLPTVDMTALTSDVATALGWVLKNIATYGGDPARLLVMGHSAGGQLAALMCTDEKYVLLIDDSQGVHARGCRHLRHPRNHRSGRNARSRAPLAIANQRSSTKVRQ